MQRLLTWISGLMVTFFAFGVAGAFCGAACWLGFYLGARGRTMITLAHVTTVVGFASGVAMAVGWYWRRCRSGNVAITPRAALVACLTLPIGSIVWAVLVDATAWHAREDIVRPAFDYAMMFLVLGAVLPMALAVPWVAVHLRRRAGAGGVDGRPGRL